MKIRIKNLKGETIIGVYAHERMKSRPVVINIELEFDHRASAQSDSLSDTVDYALIEDHVLKALAEQQFMLLEALADHIARLVMGFAGVQSVVVEIDKPGALKQAESVSVVHRLTR
ncbi:MAG: dihydroneopterin aldolase [Alphaproteobacteria bacterium]|nr:dihydroneopterin aldolase [Alphaproteobacteria bacterium]